MSDIAVAFSGSGFKVPGHVAALEAIEAFDYYPKELAGTSGGSIVAALYACGMPVSVMKELCMTKDWSDMIDLEFSAVVTGSYCTGDVLEDFLREHMGTRTFKQAKIPLRIVASDVAYNKPFIFSPETTPNVPIALAVRASASIPLVYKPVKYEEKVLVDGGLVNNIPVDRLVIPGLPRIGIQMHSEEVEVEEAADLKWPWNMIGRVLNLMIQMSENTHIGSAKMNGARMAFIESGFCNSLDTNMDTAVRERLYMTGFQATSKVLAEMRKEAGQTKFYPEKH